MRKGLYVNLLRRLGRADAGRRTSGERCARPRDIRGRADVRLAVESDTPAEFDLNLRVPAWCQSAARSDELYTPRPAGGGGVWCVRVNGQAARRRRRLTATPRLRRTWKAGDVVEVDMEMPARRIAANPKVARRRPAGSRWTRADRLLHGVDRQRGAGAERVVAGRRRTADGVPAGPARRRHGDPGSGGGVVRRRSRPRPIELTAHPVLRQRQPRPGVAVRVDPAVGGRRAAGDGRRNCHGHRLAHEPERHPGRPERRPVAEAFRRRIDPPLHLVGGHRGTPEWVQYTFDRPVRLSAAAVYWWDERRVGRHCRVPAAWHLEYLSADGKWSPVRSAPAMGRNWTGSTSSRLRRSRRPRSGSGPASATVVRRHPGVAAGAGLARPVHRARRQAARHGAFTNPGRAKMMNGLIASAWACVTALFACSVVGAAEPEPPRRRRWRSFA